MREIYRISRWEEFKQGWLGVWSGIYEFWGWLFGFIVLLFSIFILVTLFIAIGMIIYRLVP